MDRDEINGLLRAAVMRFASFLPAADVRSVWELVGAGEPGIALENLCTQLYEYDVVIDRPTQVMLETAAREMGVGSGFVGDLSVADS